MALDLPFQKIPRRGPLTAPAPRGYGPHRRKIRRAFETSSNRDTRALASRECDRWAGCELRNVRGQCDCGERAGSVSNRFGGLPVFGSWKINPTTGKTEFCISDGARCVDVTPNSQSRSLTAPAPSGRSRIQIAGASTGTKAQEDFPTTPRRAARWRRHRARSARRRRPWRSGCARP